MTSTLLFFLVSKVNSSLLKPGVKMDAFIRQLQKNLIKISTDVASHIYVATEATVNHMIGWWFYMLPTKNRNLLIAKLWRSFAEDATKENYGAASTAIKSKSSCDSWCHEIHHQKLSQEVPCSETPKRQFQPWCCRLLDPQNSVSCRSGFAKFFLGKKWGTVLWRFNKGIPIQIFHSHLR